jgi:hypothetical protein
LKRSKGMSWLRLRSPQGEAVEGALHNAGASVLLPHVVEVSEGSCSLRPAPVGPKPAKPGCCEQWQGECRKHRASGGWGTHNFKWWQCCHAPSASGETRGTSRLRTRNRQSGAVEAVFLREGAPMVSLHKVGAVREAVRSAFSSLVGRVYVARALLRRKGDVLVALELRRQGHFSRCGARKVCVGVPWRAPWIGGPTVLLPSLRSCIASGRPIASKSGGCALKTARVGPSGGSAPR